LWTQNHYYPYIKLRKIFEKKLEKDSLSNADLLVTVSEPRAKKLRLLHPKKSIIAIANGYDFDDTLFNAKLTKEFSITYTGQLYQGKRDPINLFIATKELISERLIERANIRIRFLAKRRAGYKEKLMSLDYQI